jgi:hypothetical protein
VITGQEGATSLAHHQNKLASAWFCLAVALQQVNLRVEPGLLASFKEAAKERGLSLNAAAALAFEQFLQGQPQQNQADASSELNDLRAEVELGATRLSRCLNGQAELTQRLAALEQRMARLEATPAPPPPAAKASPERAKPAPPAEPAKIPQASDGTITTADLAIATGTNRKAWNNWARDKNPGAIRKMKPEVGNWRYLGKAPSEMGGPERGLWEPA